MKKVKKVKFIAHTEKEFLKIEKSILNDFVYNNKNAIKAEKFDKSIIDRALNQKSEEK